MPRTTLVVCVLAAALLVPCVAGAAQTPTLGELALKEQARRKALKDAAGKMITPAGKIITNDDLPRGVTPPPPQAPVPAVQGAADDKAAATPEEPPKDEAWWKQRISQVREELRRNEMFADALQTRINSLTNDFAMRDDPYQRAAIAERRSKAVLELDRVKADVELNRTKIAAIEDEARRAGVPPGWLR
jgi:hypothetical protein